MPHADAVDRQGKQTIMKLGLIWGYWGQLPPPNLIEATQEAERLGYDSVWTSEAWGSDAFGPLAYLAGHTERIKLGTAVVQLAARTPTATAMHVLTLDHLSGGRVILGLGVSGPQVVEGWYGQPSNRPLARTREYVEIIRRALAREEPVEFDGEFFQHPYHGPGSVGLGKPLKSITHPLRRRVPIYLGAEGPKNVTQTAEIADGWLPLYYSPHHQEVYADQLAGASDDFEIAAMVQMNIDDDLDAALLPVKMMVGFYIGGMGAKGQNYHTKLMERFGYGDEALHIQQLFMDGKRDEAIAAVPDEFADAISLCGPLDRIRERLDAWKASPVTTLLVTGGGDPHLLRTAAELVLD
jgi:F420-dependent oxidoreductase-like protein